MTCVGTIFPKTTETIFKSVQGWLITNTSWIYVLAVGTFLFFAIWLIVSRKGDIRLGPDHSTPEYSNLSWFAMLFSAGMGIGLLFFGVAEPIMHFSSPPVGDPMSVEAAREAMKITFFHWGLHAWGIYAVLAVTLAYFSYRKNLPLLPRSAFYPFLKDKIYGPIGDVIDVFAVIGTMFGVATSLGFGVSQVNAGLNYLYGVEQSTMVQVGLIAVITLIATGSVVMGLDKGIKRLSNLNMILAVSLLVFVLLFGETVLILKSYVQNTGAYLSDLIHKTFNLYAYEKKEDWVGGWTLLYWGWWVSWAPFVGMFIARISRGRTIRSFMVGVLFVPAGFTFLWMTVFGNSAIDLILNKNAMDLAEAVNSNVPVAIFKLLEFFPASTLLSVIALCLVVTFFVSSSDSGSLVIDTLSSGGAKEPPVWQRVYWAVLEGTVAAVLLYAGGLDALQTMTIASAFPMMFLIFIGSIAFVRTLNDDYKLLDAVQNHQTAVQYSQASTPWQDRLESLVAHPEKADLKKFITESVKPALKEVASELLDKGMIVKMKSDQNDLAGLTILNDGVENFSYEVRARSFSTPTYAVDDSDKFCRAEVFVLQGGQQYDVYGYTKEQIIADFLTQYEKHLHYLHLNHGERPT